MSRFLHVSWSILVMMSLFWTSVNPQQCFWNCSCIVIVDINCTDCTQLGFFSVPRTETPSVDGVESTSVSPHILTLLYYVSIMNLSHNQIKVIRQCDFVNFVNLESLDLSYNSITTIEQDSFVNNSKLTVLYLHNNPSLTMPENDTFLNSPSLRSLDLRNCGLENVPEVAFQKLPQLSSLDLSNNNLTSLPPVFTNYLPVLSSLRIANNSWICGSYLDVIQETFNDTQNVNCTNQTQTHITQVAMSLYTTALAQDEDIPLTVAADFEVITTGITLPEESTSEMNNTVQYTTTESVNSTNSTDIDIDSDEPLVPYWLLGIFIACILIVLLVVIVIILLKHRKAADVPTEYLEPVTVKQKLSSFERKSQLSLNCDKPRGSPSLDTVIRVPRFAQAEQQEDHPLMVRDRKAAALLRNLEISNENILDQPNNLNSVFPTPAVARDRSSFNLIEPSESSTEDEACEQVCVQNE